MESTTTSAPSSRSVFELLGVQYEHLKLADGADLYLTRHGQLWREQLMPENWYAEDWFRKHRVRLRGTSTVYRVPTRPAAGRRGRPLQIVVKWSRVGQEVPLETRVIEEMLSAEFNSPFEEFSLVEELRASRRGGWPWRMLTHRPLAIYVPPEKLQLWQTGRSRYKIERKLLRHPGVEIDILRDYIMVYEWIRGIDAAEVFQQLRKPTEELHALTHRVRGELAAKGFVVADMKPAHIIVRKRNDGSLASRRGQVVYALVDFELLGRTPEYEEERRRIRRAEYHLFQERRFSGPDVPPLPAHLWPVTIFGVDYVYGVVESTGGRLWVVGHDARLYDYFQPERWRKTPCVQLSSRHQVFYTRTKDHINLVWKTSRVGEKPDLEIPEAAALAEQGYNSPFEEFAIALELERLGVPVTQPRAIYKTGSTSANPDYLADRRRFDSHAALRTPDGEPILRPDHDYIKVWGFWNGPEEVPADLTDIHRHALNADQAVREGRLKPAQVHEMVEWMKERLAAAGYGTPWLASHHLLLSRDARGRFHRDIHGRIECRLCNFEFVRKI
ncbi:MAG: hypothetical protein BWZ08_01678 [candidate division BRC1 bacterium ADurb.BinA292]|nr:MAG: hypothetical protein BWZ08_01678 [candidate division BRC1 bacterium ADurb.BinA292]